MFEFQNLVHQDYQSFFKLLLVQFKLFSLGWNYTTNFKRTEKWVNFKLNYHDLNLDLSKFENELESMFDLLFKIMTNDCASNDLISIQISSSNNNEVTIPSKTLAYYEENSLFKLMTSHIKKYLDSEKIEFKIISVQSSRLLKQ